MNRVLIFKSEIGLNEYLLVSVCSGGSFRKALNKVTRFSENTIEHLTMTGPFVPGENVNVLLLDPLMELKGGVLLIFKHMQALKSLQTFYIYFYLFIASPPAPKYF